MSGHDLVRRTGVELRADPSRVVARLFVPGNELATDHRSRAGSVVERVLAMPEDTVEGLAADVVRRWAPRHRDLARILRATYGHVAHRVPEGTHLSEARRTLLSAYFTQEQAVEAAALLNPAVVPHPDQGGLPEGAVRFVMSVRAVGEGHVSCIGWRSGVLDADGAVSVDDPGPHVETGVVDHGTFARGLFSTSLLEAGADAEAASYLVSQLPGTFTLDDLDHALLRVHDSQHAGPHGDRTESLARHLASRTYVVTFPEETALAERVLRPYGPTESQGMEDARLVRFVDADGAVTYRGTYTAFDGRGIVPQLLQTDDFRRFRVSVLSGPAAVDKGMALFPRTVGGKHLALTRSDRETTGVATSTDGYHWSAPVPLLGPERPWDLIQTGNCGSPVETGAGWLVLTHGVGPMREYCLGAVLLDLDDPTRVIGALDEPLMRPTDDEREGYVPNVLYSCGAMAHGDLLLLPYGCSDQRIRFAVVDLPGLLERLTGSGSPRPPG